MPPTAESHADKTSADSRQSHAHREEAKQFKTHDVQTFAATNCWFQNTSRKGRTNMTTELLHSDVFYIRRYSYPDARHAVTSKP